MKAIGFYFLAFVTCTYSFYEAKAFNPLETDTVKMQDSVFFTINTGCEIWMKKNLILYDKENSEINDYTSLERGFLSGSRGVYPFISFSYETKQPLRHNLGFSFMKNKYENNRGIDADPPLLKIKSYSVFYQLDYNMNNKDRQKFPFRFYIGSRFLLDYLVYGASHTKNLWESYVETTTFQKNNTILLQLIPRIELKGKVSISIGLHINIATWIMGNYHYTYSYTDSRYLTKKYYEQDTEINKIAFVWNLYKEKLMINTFTLSIGYRFSMFKSN